MTVGSLQDQTRKVTQGWRRRFVTVRGEQGEAEVDLEMPGDRPVRVLLPDLLKALGWPVVEGEQLIGYQLRIAETGQILSDTESLNDAGVENGDVLQIALPKEQQPSDAVGVPSATGHTGQTAEGLAQGISPIAVVAPSPQDRRGTLAPPRAAQMAFAEPSLVSAKGYIFILGDPPISIGRANRDAKPDIDLTELDTGHVSSRPIHAEIHREAEDFILQPMQTTNGTFVNGVEIQPGERCSLHDGDVIQFGYRGVELTIHLPSSAERRAR